MRSGLHVLGATSAPHTAPARTTAIVGVSPAIAYAPHGGDGEQGGGKAIAGIAALLAALVIGGGFWYAKVWLAGKALKSSGVLK